MFEQEHLRFVKAYDPLNDRFMARLTWISAGACHDVETQYDPRDGDGLRIVAILLPRLIEHVEKYKLIKAAS